jgi:hypothetical protein
MFVHLQITTLRTEPISCVDLIQLQNEDFPLQPQHSVCCPLNRKIIMKAVTLAVLLVLLIFAVACIFTGAPAESGKLRYGHETCLVVILQALKCNYIAVFSLNHELLHEDGWGNAGKIPGILNIGFRCRSQDSVPVLLKKLRGAGCRSICGSIPGTDKVFIMQSFSSVS